MSSGFLRRHHPPPSLRPNETRRITAGLDAYYQGDYQRAYQLCLMPAEHGITQAQIVLGLMYAIGQYVPQDCIIALMWFTFAANSGDQKAQIARTLLSRLMSPAQIAQTQQRIADFEMKSSTIVTNLMC